jgi:hypothetical protein
MRGLFEVSESGTKSQSRDIGHGISYASTGFTCLERVESVLKSHASIQFLCRIL